jgi:nicotinamidase-related amidase
MTTTTEQRGPVEVMTAAAPGTVRGTDPYPWPYAGLPAPHRMALVVAGADPHWIARCPDAAALEVATRIAATAAPLRTAGVRIVHVEHDRPARAPEVGPPAVAPTSLREHDDVVVVAGGIDGFYGSTLDLRLRQLGCDHLLVCGFGLEAPVHSTLRGANDQGYECLLLTDACAPLDPDTTSAALSMITMSGGIFGALGLTADLLSAIAHLPHPQPSATGADAGPS